VVARRLKPRNPRKLALRVGLAGNDDAAITIGTRVSRCVHVSGVYARDAPLSSEWRWRGLRECVSGLSGEPAAESGRAPPAGTSVADAGRPTPTPAMLGSAGTVRSGEPPESNGGRAAPAVPATGASGAVAASPPAAGTGEVVVATPAPAPPRANATSADRVREKVDIRGRDVAAAAASAGRGARAPYTRTRSPKWNSRARRIFSRNEGAFSAAFCPLITRHTHTHTCMHQ
jgi:hypothetical protein